MIAGYVRLSRDDDGQHYSSIENQKLIILQYAKSNQMNIDYWFEDDGISGYRFDRPQFQKMMAALSSSNNETRIDTILVKDFSRLGRHNAKVLLLLDEFQKKGCRFIAVDDNYDSLEPDDDSIGIKTWYNERYIKDTSKKIRRVINTKQKNGTLLSQVPFGYRRCEQNRQLIEIIPEESNIVTTIYTLYLQGMGYRKVAGFLNESGTPTPSLMRYGHDCQVKSSSNRYVALKWSDSMVKEILDNDFYTGVYRLHKRARRFIHGTDLRVPPKEQYVFSDHHPAIISPADFSKVQQLKSKRMHGKEQFVSCEHSSPSQSPFSHLLICKDCGHHMVPVTRKNKNNIRKYYICSTYNRKGKQFCPSSHLIQEWILWEAVWYYIRLCSKLFSDSLASLDSRTLLPLSKPEIPLSPSPLQTARQQLNILLEQKSRDLLKNPHHSTLLLSAYDSLESRLLSHIHELESNESPHVSQLSTTNSTKVAPQSNTNVTPTCAIHILKQILNQGILTKDDLRLFIEAIYVDSHGIAEIHFRCFIPPDLLSLHNAWAVRWHAADGV